MVVRRFSLPRHRMLAFLDGLEAPDAPEMSASLYLPPDLSPEQTAEYLSVLAYPDRGEILRFAQNDRVAQNDTWAVTLSRSPERNEGTSQGAGEGSFLARAPELPELVSGSKTGAVVFWGPSQRYLVLPPFPISEKRIGPGLITAPLKELLNRDLKIALVLVRLGAYAIGLARGEGLVGSKVGTGNIHARHRQGGSSAARFARHREKQIESFLTRVCGHLQEILGADGRAVDHIVYGGSNTAILLLRKRCPYLGRFHDRRLPDLLDLPEPRQPVLEGAVTRVWSSAVLEWRDDPGV